VWRTLKKQARVLIKFKRSVTCFKTTFKNSGRALLACACPWRTEGVEMMCNARLFARVVKPDFTEHRNRLCIARQRDCMSLFCWKKLCIFSWSSVTSLVVHRLSHMKNSIFQLNCMYVPTVNQHIPAVRPVIGLSTKGGSPQPLPWIRPWHCMFW